MESDMKNGLIRYFDGSSYRGSLLTGRRSGIGSLRISNGDYYEGSFEKGVRSGYGVLV
jgi:hypothetical protein